MFEVFTRNWWKKNPSWPNGLEPDGAGRRNHLAWAETEEEAREIAQEWNANNDPGILSRKAEFTKY